MHKAAEGGQLEMIKFLSPMFGTRVHEKDNFGFTVLHLAAQRGHCEVARYLIDELKMDPQDRDKVCGVPGEGKMCDCLLVWLHFGHHICMHFAISIYVCMGSIQWEGQFSFCTYVQN